MTKKMRYSLFATSALIAALAGWFLAAEMWILQTYPGWIGTVILALVVLPAWITFLHKFNRRGLIAGVLLVIAGLIIEALAVKTGWPYSGFEYGSLAEPKIAELPVAVPFLWSALVMGAWQLGSMLSPRSKSAIAWAVVLLVAVDVVLDPPAARLGVWSWDSPGVFYGIPLQNFAGWIFSGVIGVGLLSRFITSDEIKPASPWISSAFLWMSAFWVGAGIFFQQWWAALVGLVLVTLFLERLKETQSSS